MLTEQTNEITRLILNAALDAIVFTDSTGTISFWNPQAERIFGFKADEVTGKKLSETIIPPKLRLRHEEGMRRYAATGEAHIVNRIIEMQAMRRDGSEIPVELTVVPVVDNGKHYFCGYIRDISDRKKAAEEFKKEKEVADFVFDNLPGIYYLQDEKGNYLRWNKNFEKASGFTPEEIRRMNPLDFFLPEDRPRVEEAIRKVFTEGKAEIVVDAINSENKIIPFYLKARAFTYEGKKCLIGTGTDLSQQLRAQMALKKSEEKYRSLFEQASDPIMVTDLMGNFLDVNESLCKLFGYTKQELMEMNIRDVVDAEELSTRPIKFDQLLSGEHVFSRRKMVHKDGHIIEVEANVKKISETSILAIARDITQRLKVESELAESENRLRTIFETEPECIKLMDSGCRLIEMNPAGLKLIEADSADQVIGQNVLHIVDPKFRKVFLDVTREVFSGNARRLDFSITGLKGTNRWMEMHAVPLRNHNGEIIYVLSVARDITEKRNAAEAIRKSEERYRTLVENATEALVVYDVENDRFESVSESAVEFFKMSKEKLLQLSPLEISPEYQPDGRSSLDIAKEKMAEVLRGGKPCFEWTLCDAHGNRIPCEIRLVRLPSDTRLLVRGSILNIAERKKNEEAILLSEQKYKLMFNENPLPMLMIAQENLRIIDVNEAAIRQYGYSREEFLQMTAMDIRPEEDHEAFRKIIGENPALMSDFGIWRHKKKDGSILYAEVRAHLVMNDNKPAWLALTNDVTERQKAEAEIHRSHEELRQLSSYLETIREEERTNIAREIHDELGQQLTGLKMDASWLNKKISKDQKFLREKVTGMISLIDDTVKTVRRISTELRPGILDDLGLLDALQWQSHEFEKRTGIACRFHTSFQESPFDKKLSTGIFRVFQETLTNVARHAHASEISTSLERSDESLVLQVADNGKGFDEPDIRKKKTLGLVGMKERAKMFGGKLTIQSAAGKGTVITLSVPMTIASPVENEIQK